MTVLHSMQPYFFLPFQKVVLDGDNLPTKAHREIALKYLQHIFCLAISSISNSFFKLWKWPISALGGSILPAADTVKTAYIALDLDA